MFRNAFFKFFFFHSYSFYTFPSFGSDLWMFEERVHNCVKESLNGSTLYTVLWFGFIVQTYS